MKQLQPHSMISEIATNLHNLISKWWTGLRFFWRSSAFRSNEYLYAVVKSKLLDYIEWEKSDWWAIRTWSLSPLVDLAIKTWVIDEDEIMFYYTLYDYTAFVKKMNPEIFRDPSWTVALCDNENTNEYIPKAESPALNDIKYIYSDWVSTLFLMWTIESFMQSHHIEIAFALSELQRWK